MRNENNYAHITQNKNQTTSEGIRALASQDSVIKEMMKMIKQVIIKLDISQTKVT